MLKPFELSKSGRTSFQDVHAQTPRDVISLLPDHLLSEILSRMPLRDAAKTRLLSHRWQLVCWSLDEIDIDVETMFGDLLLEEDSSDQLQPYRDEFVRRVSQFIEFYRGSQIQSFKLSFRLGNGQANDIDQWIRFAIRKGVRQLRLDFYCSRSSYVGGTQNSSWYLFHSDLLEGAELSLRDLYVSGCIVQPDFPVHLTRLQSLFLNHVAFDKHDLQSMFPCFVNLEALKLRQCRLPEDLSLALLRRLKEFFIIGCKGGDKIHLSNANLLIFGTYTSKVVQVDLSGAPNLLELHWGVLDEELHYVFTYLPMILPKLKFLALHLLSGAKWVNGLPKIKSIFSTVTQLQLFFCRDSNLYVGPMLPMLKAFPFLEKLILTKSCRKNGAKHMQEETLAVDRAFKNLKEVEVAACPDIELIKFISSLLEYVALEQLTFAHNMECYDCKGLKFWSKKECFHICKKLLHTSKDLRVKFEL